MLAILPYQNESIQHLHNPSKFFDYFIIWYIKVKTVLTYRLGQNTTNFLLSYHTLLLFLWDMRQNNENYIVKKSNPSPTWVLRHLDMLTRHFPERACCTFPFGGRKSGPCTVRNFHKHNWSTIKEFSYCQNAFHI